MPTSYQLVATAFLRTTGGRVRVLFAVDLDGVQLHDGEPVLLVEHRPGHPPGALDVDAAAVLDASVAELVVREAGTAIVDLVEAAFDDTGAFDGQRLLGRIVELDAPAGSFGM